MILATSFHTENDNYIPSPVYVFSILTIVKISKLEWCTFDFCIQWHMGNLMQIKWAILSYFLEYVSNLDGY